ncbi:HIT domain-containing protein [Candidatus Omnitrophota bacterium]
MPQHKGMKRLWSPWRIEYIKNIQKEKGCIFCKAYKSKKDAKCFVVKRMKHCFCLLNIYPYNNGHVMIAPNRHVNDIDKLTVVERNGILSLTIEIQKALKKILRPNGFNIGMNIGDVAGAGIKEHIHMHIVPRWNGDTNFMPTLSDTKVISQSLEELYESLRNVIARRV